MKITIITVSGSQAPIDVEPNSTILAIKEKLSSIVGINKDQLRLLFNSRPLSDQETVQSANILEGAVIHSTPAFRAG